MLDGAVFAQMLRPSRKMTMYRLFKDYIVGKCSFCELIAVVFDIYFADSLKAATRQGRGKSLPMNVSLAAPLLTESNKIGLFQLIAYALITINPFLSKVYVTKDSTVLSPVMYHQVFKKSETQRYFSRPCSLLQVPL